MATESKAVVGCEEQKPNTVIQRADSVIAGLDGNADYTPNPIVADLITMRDDAVDKRTLWGSRNDHGSTQDKINFEASVKVLYKGLVQECNGCNNQTPNDAVKLATTGFPLNSQPVKGVLMTPPQSLYRMINKTLGQQQAKIRWKKPGNAGKKKSITYLVYRSMNPNFASASVVKVVTKCSYLETPPIPNGSSSATYYYWTAALTPAGESQPSDVCQVVVAVPN